MASCQVSKGDFTPCFSQNRIPIRSAIGTGCEPPDSSGSLRCFDPTSKLSLTNQLNKHLHHPFQLLYVYPFLHLVYPFATASFRRLSLLLRVHPPLCRFVKRYYLLRVPRLMPCALQLFVRPGAPAGGFTY